MKTLKEINGYRIIPQRLGSRHDGEFFVTYGDRYLHTDGEVRFSTRNDETGKFTGYFQTIEEAEAVIARRVGNA